MTWYFLTVGNEDVGSAKTEEIKADFEKAFAAARGPRQMALFRRDRDDGGADLFFTPACIDYAADLLERLGCLPCERPSLVGLHLLVGHSEITYYMP